MLLLIIISLFIITFLVLLYDEEVTLTLMKSYIQEDVLDRKSKAFILAGIFPITLPHYLFLKFKNKLSLKKFINISITILVLFLTVYTTNNIVNRLITFKNTEISQTNQFNSQEQQRITYWDNKIYKAISQNTQIAIKNDSSFTKVVQIVMDGQPNNLAAYFGALQLIDPSSNYEGSVASFYASLRDIINNNREGLFQQEQALQEINRQHENLLNQFPGNIYNLYFKRPSFKYVPILSTKASEVGKIGIDDNINLLN